MTAKEHSLLHEASNDLQSLAKTMHEMAKLEVPCTATFAQSYAAEKISAESSNYTTATKVVEFCGHVSGASVPPHPPRLLAQEVPVRSWEVEPESVASQGSP